MGGQPAETHLISLSPVTSGDDGGSWLRPHLISLSPPAGARTTQRPQAARVGCRGQGGIEEAAMPGAAGACTPRLMPA